MTYTLELPPDTEARAQAQADAQGLAVEEYLVSLIEDALPAPPREFKTGADLVAYWQSIGFVGIWADREDMKDSTEYVRRLRQKIQTDWQRE